MLRLLMLFAVVLMVPACARLELASHVIKQLPVPESQQSKGTFKVGSPYKIAGTRYYPDESYTLVETGMASWYGPNFHGKKTANGEIFDKYELTAAHRTLQMPSIVRVTNLENGRSIIVRINDRGPFAKNRIIDMSQRGAELLGFRNQGTARVKVEVLSEESRKVAALARQGHDTRGYEVALNRNPPPVQRTAAPVHPVQRESIFVQAGAFGSESSAYALANQLRGYGNVKVSPTFVNGNSLYRVRIGPIVSRPQADQVLQRLAVNDIGNPILIVE